MQPAPTLTTITIREKDYTDNVFTVTTSFDGAGESEVQFINPYNPSTNALLEWYFEQYINQPFDDVKVKEAVGAIEEYGIKLFNQLFAQGTSYQYRTAMQQGLDSLTIEIIGKTPAFQAIYWESLRDPKFTDPLAAQGTVFVRKHVEKVNIPATANPSPTINLLIVTARPNEESDVSYRTIQRPLINLIQQTATRIRPYILRPGTYEALVRHLEDKTGHYHIIHFDLHGGLLDYAAYKRFQDPEQRLPSQQHMLFKGQFALKDLEEKDFNGGKRAFLFFESEEKGKAVAVEALQLAGMLEQRHIPICILNACQSAKQEGSAHETSLGRVLIQKGIQLVLAMRYSISVTAAEIMMERLYYQLYNKNPIEQAIATSRRELYLNKERKALYNRDIKLEDWMLPVVYQNGRATPNIRPFTFEEEQQYILEQQLPEEAEQELPYGFFGRDLDILKIEKNLLLRSNILLLQGMGGAGKTTLLKYLAGWWLRTGFIEKVFYFGYDVKAHSLHEIFNYIAQALYTKPKYALFTAKHATVQENNIVTALKTNSYALILDNVESITGEKLAIPNTLPEPERKSLKKFISQLKGGKSFVIIGSRASEKWLKSSTFENNQYLLRGLDAESATDFALQILKNVGVPETTVKKIVKDADFERLMKLLAGYPLALKAILPNLKQKTTRRILQELQEGIDDLDKGNAQQRTESIIKCIEYAHSNLSDDAQKLLLCLSPFQSVVNLNPNIIKDYFEELGKEQQFQHYPFDKLETVVQEAVQNGFMQEVAPGSSTQLMALQPVFTFFLKNRLGTESAQLQQSLQSAYISYYRRQSGSLFQYLSSKESREQQIGMLYIRHEYENLYQVLSLSLNRQQRVLDVYRVINEYLSKNELHEKRLELAEEVQERMERYSAQSLSDEIGFELGYVKQIIAVTYQILKRYETAKQTYEQILTFIDTYPSFFKTPQLNKAQVYHNLGIISRNQKDYIAARDYYLKALDVYVQFSDLYRQGQVYQNLGVVSKEQKDYPAARDYYLKALNIFMQFSDLHKQGEVYQNLGVVSKEQKDYPAAAREYYLKALDIYVQFNDLHSQGQVYHSLGNILLNQKDYAATREYYLKALNIFVQLNNLHSQGEIYYSLGVISWEQKDYPAARDYYEKALDAYLHFPEDFDSITNLLSIIQDFAKETTNKAFGQSMVQKALPYFDGENKDHLLKILDDINQL